MENPLKKEDVISEEVCIEELIRFVDKYTYEEVEEDKIIEDYPQVLKAMKKGLIKFDEDLVPTVILAFPLMSDDGESVMLGKVDEFRTRITPNDLARITKGVNVTKQQVEYILKCLEHITGLRRIWLNKIDKFDYKVLEQLSTVFF